jgi:hypothetical protein
MKYDLIKQIDRIKIDERASRKKEDGKMNLKEWILFFSFLN